MDATPPPAKSPLPAVGAEAPLDDDRVVRLWTPERVPLSVPLAGLGERALAYGTDLSILVAVLIAALFVYNFWGDLEADYGALSSLGKLLVFCALLVAFVLYDVLFEVFGDGRTPGKRLLRLRVLSGSGRAPDATSSLLRNVLRVVDFAPFLYGVGIVTLFVTGTRRLGDLLADTFVVTERARRLDPFANARRLAGAAGPLAAAPSIPDARFLAALEIVERSAGLERPVLDRLARRFLARECPDLLEGSSEEAASVVLSRALLAWRARAGGLGAQIARMTHAEEALARALLEVAERPDVRSVERLDDAIRRAASELMRATRRGVPARLAESLSLALLDAERRRARDARPGRLLAFLGRSVPATVFAERKQIGRAALVFALSTAIGLSLAYGNAALGNLLVGPALGEAIEQGAKWTDRIEESGRFAEVALFIILNNAWVAVVAFLSGLLGGTGPLLVLFANGLHLGSVLGYALRLGTADTLLKFMLAHGPTELAAICVAGAAGLCLGRALLAPGRRTRLEALREEAAIGGRLLVAALFALGIIGLVEGFVSPGKLFPWQLNLAVGLTVFSLFCAWIAIVGRAASHRQMRPAPLTST